MIKKLEADKKYLEDIGIPTHDSKMHDNLIEMAKTDPKQAYQMIKTGVLQSGQNAAQTNLVTPRPESIGGVGYSYTPAGNEALPLGQGNQSAQPAQPAQQPIVQQEDLNKPVYSQKEALKYPQRDLSKPFTPILGEEIDRQANQKYRLNLVDQQAALVPYKRNVEEVVQKTSEILNQSGADWTKAGWGGNIRRFISKAAGGTDYTDLSKDLANVQLAALKSNGGDLGTDAGKSLISHANGDETYPPQTLIKIARRTYGDIINTDMQATASQKAAEKYGDNNLGKFRKEWSKNADSKVFEIMSLPQLIKDPTQRKKMADEIIGFPVGSKQREVFLNKYKNIQKLSQDGAL